jgi:hypothetical protein
LPAGELDALTAADMTCWILERDARVRELAPPSDDDGLDIARVDGFLASKRLAPPPAIIMRPAAARAYRESLAAAGYAFGGLDQMLDWDAHHFAGIHIHDVGIVLSYRSYGMGEWTEARPVTPITSPANR